MIINLPPSSNFQNIWTGNYTLSWSGLSFMSQERIVIVLFLLHLQNPSKPKQAKVQVPEKHAYTLL